LVEEFDHFWVLVETWIKVACALFGVGGRLWLWLMQRCVMVIKSNWWWGSMEIQADEGGNATGVVGGDGVCFGAGAGVEWAGGGSNLRRPPRRHFLKKNKK
jgi:hypothetical protein